MLLSHTDLFLSLYWPLCLNHVCIDDSAGLGAGTGTGTSASDGVGSRDGVGNVVPRVSCPFIIRGRHDAVINLRDTSLYQHTRWDILLPVDDDDDDDDDDVQKDDKVDDEMNPSIPADVDAVVNGVQNKSDTDRLKGLRLPNLDGSSMKFLHQVSELL